MCEGLNIVAGSNLKELMAFEKKKTDEVYEHNKLCEGLQPNVKRLRRCLEKFTECAWKYKIGSAPFTYGEFRDYWAEISSKNVTYDKRDYNATRHIAPEKKIRDAEIEKRNQMEEHLNYLFMSERDMTKAMVQQLLTQMKMQQPSGGVSK